MSFVYTREQAHMLTLIEKAIEEHLSQTKDYVNTLIEMYTVYASSTGTKVIRARSLKRPFSGLSLDDGHCEDEPQRAGKLFRSLIDPTWGDYQLRSRRLKGVETCRSATPTSTVCPPTV